MKMEYILLLKKQDGAIDADEKVNRDIQNIYGKSHIFELVAKRTKVEISRIVQKRKLDNVDGSAYYFTLISNEKKKQKAIEALEIAHNMLMQNSEIRKNYNIIVLYDDISSYYSIKAYSIFHEYEKQMRRLIYKLLAMCWGTMWAKITIDEALKAQIKDRTKGISDEKLIEQALHEMDMFQLEKFLFTPQREMPLDCLVDEYFNDENMGKLSKEEMVDAINKARAQSIWEKYFASHIVIENLKDKMDTIRINRNKVAHNKTFMSEDFKVSMLILKDEGLIDKLSTGVDNLEMIELDLFEWSSVIRDFAEFGRRVSESAAKLSASMALISQGFVENQKRIMDNISPALRALATINLQNYQAIAERQQQVMNSVVINAAKALQVQTAIVDNDWYNEIHKRCEEAIKSSEHNQLLLGNDVIVNDFEDENGRDD